MVEGKGESFGMDRRGVDRRGVDRRELLAGAAATAAGALMSGVAVGESAPIGQPGATAPGSAGSLASFELEEATIAELAAGMARGEWSSEELVASYRARLDAVDRGRSGTNAVAEWNPEAFAIAAERDQERRAGRVHGPLHGIPIALKDNVDTGDRMRTTAGSLALAESTAAQDAFLVQRLRAAGAVIVAKTNLSEWANFRSSHSTSGWSGRSGQVRNPYALDRNPCGSSSGSAVAVAANLCSAAVGTETDGSIVCPASMNGVVGFKPTLGLVSRAGVIPIAHSQDTAGPLARTVADAALLLAGMLGTDPHDPATSAEGARWHGDVEPILDAGGLAGARLGVVRDWFGWHSEIERQMTGMLTLLREAGAVLVDPVEIPHAGDYDDAELEVLLYEFKHDLNRYLGALPRGAQPQGRLGAEPRTLAALIDWNRAHAARSMPWFGQELLERAEAKGPLTDATYLDALARCRRLSRAEGLDAAIAKERVDALVGPTMGPAYFTDWVNGDAYSGSSSTAAAVSGYPHLTVPAGTVHGLPWGLSFVGPAWSDARLLRYGHAFERASLARRLPTFVPSLAL